VAAGVTLSGSTGQRIENGRGGGSRNNDRQAGQGTASPRIASIVDEAEDGYANDSPGETTLRFPQGFGNLATKREIPTFAQPRLVSLKERRTEDQKRTTRSTNERLGRHARGGRF
jgi:hypothetical protein